MVNSRKEYILFYEIIYYSNITENSSIIIRTVKHRTVLLRNIEFLLTILRSLIIVIILSCLKYVFSFKFIHKNNAYMSINSA